MYTIHKINNGFHLDPNFLMKYFAKKVRNKNFDLKALARKYYYVEKKGNDYAIGHMDQKSSFGK